MNRRVMISFIIGFLAFQSAHAFDDTVFDHSAIEDLDLEMSEKKEKKKPAKKMIVRPDLVQGEDLPVVEQLSAAPEDEDLDLKLPQTTAVQPTVKPTRPQTNQIVLKDEEDVGDTDDLEIVQTDQMNWDLPPLEGYDAPFPTPPLTREQPQIAQPGPETPLYDPFAPTMPPPVQPEQMAEPSFPESPLEPFPTFQKPTQAEALMTVEDLSAMDEKETLKKQGPYVSLDISNLSTAEAIKAVAFAAEEKGVVPHDIPGTISIHVEDKPWLSVVDEILKSRTHQWTYKDEMLVVFEDGPKTKGPLLQQKFPIRYAKPSEIERKIRPFLSEAGSVLSEDNYGFVIVSDRAGVQKTVARIIQAIDLPSQAVYLDAKLVYVDSEISKALGFGFASTDTLSQSMNTDQIAQILGFALGSSVASMLQNLVSENRAKLLSAPNLTTLNNQHVMIGRTEEIIYTNKTQIRFDTDTFLSIEPRIINQDYIELSIFMNGAIVTSPSKNVAKQTIETHRASTTLRVKRGETAVISGFQRSDNEEAAGNNTLPARNMVIFITPRFEVAKR